MSKWSPADFIATILIAGYIFLAWKGLETMLTTAVMLVVGFYFGAKHSNYINGIE